MADWILWGLVGLMVGWHTPTPVWATWFWNKVWGWFGQTPPSRD